jgi:hypothetical protein
MILCRKLKNVLCKIVTKSQVVTKFNVTKSRLHCTCNFEIKARKLSKLRLNNSTAGAEESGKNAKKSPRARGSCYPRTATGMDGTLTLIFRKSETSRDIIKYF